MFKIFNKNLLLSGVAILLVVGCSQKESVGNMMMKSANVAEKDLTLKKQLAEQWEKGSELLADGKEQVEDGKDYVEKGEDLIEEGEDNMAKGKRLISESKNTFEQKFPGIKLTK